MTKQVCNCCGIEKDINSFSKYYCKKAYHTRRKVCEKCRYDKYFRGKKYGTRFKWKEATKEEKIKRMQESFAKKTKKESGCLLWTGYVDYDGYGRTIFDGLLMRCNRIAWIINIGPIPDGMLVCHHCDRPECVEISHLFLGTPKDNTQDMLKKGRKLFKKGEECNFAKLSEKEVVEIKKLLKTDETMTRIAYKFDVSYGTISDIKHGYNWKHVKLD